MRAPEEGMTFSLFLISMSLESILESVFIFQNSISSGSVILGIEDNKIAISRDCIIVDIQDIKRLMKLAEIFQEQSSLRDKMQTLEVLARMFNEFDKTLIVKYRGSEVAIVGKEAHPGFFDPKNVEIKNKFTLLRLLSSLW